MRLIPLDRRERMERARFGIVLLLIVATYIVAVTVEGPTSFGIVMLMQFVTLWVVFTISNSRRAQIIAAVGGVVVTLVIVADILIGQDAAESFITRILVIVSVLLYVIAPAAIFRRLLERPTIDVQALMGAICSYLLIGMMFAFAFRAISVYQDRPFFTENPHNTMANFLFFSFITMTTVGYGNLVPAENPGQSIAVLEAIVGQLFLVTAVAKIVTAWRLPNAPGKAAQAPDPTPQPPP